MEIAPGVHLIATSQVNLFLVEIPDGLMIVDTGLPLDTDKILIRIRQLGFDPARIRVIFLTHGDGDHVGGAARLKAMTGASVLASAAEAPLIEGRAARPVGSTGLAKVVGPLIRLVLQAPPLRAKPVKVDRLVEDGDIVGDGWQVVALPGHTSGHVGLYHAGRGVLLAGDALQNRNGVKASPPMLTGDMAAARASIEKAASLNYDVLGVGHGPPVMKAASAAVKKMAVTL